MPVSPGRRIRVLLPSCSPVNSSRRLGVAPRISSGLRPWSFRRSCAGFSVWSGMLRRTSSRSHPVCRPSGIKAKLYHVPFGSGDVDLEMTRDGTMLAVRATGPSAQQVVLASHTPGAKWANNMLRIPLPPVEAGLTHTLPEPGATTQQMKVIDQQSSAHSLTLTLSALANSHQTVLLRINDPHIQLHIDGAEVPQRTNSSAIPCKLISPPAKATLRKQSDSPGDLMRSARCS